MSKIKLYISTYNNENRINLTVGRLAETNNIDKVEINVINNHTNFKLKNSNLKINVIHNATRPDFSSGHLSRTWNQCLVNGFRSLKNPDCDILITAQDDTYFDVDWVNKVEELVTQYEFVQNGHGDHICVYTPVHVKKTGIWDERFCGISRQAADYFFRCLLYNKDNSSINDIGHKRINNPIFNNDLLKSQNYLVDSRSREIFGDEVYDNTTDNKDSISLNLLKEKYGQDPFPWDENLFKKIPNILKKIEKAKLSKNYMFYPYFEKDILNLNKKNFLL